MLGFNREQRRRTRSANSATDQRFTIYKSWQPANRPHRATWQYVFPASRHYVDRHTGIQHRHHIHETVIQQAVRDAARKAQLTKHVTPHVLRHSFATDLVTSNHDIRTIHDLAS